jgi:hypothetical protein
VLSLRGIDRSAQGAQFGEAAIVLARYRDSLTAAIPILEAAEPWSLFKRDIHDAHFAALKQLYRRAIDPASIVHPRLDID